MASLSDTAKLCNKPINECYHLYSDARNKLEGYGVCFNEGFEPEYPKFLYNDSGNISYEEFQKCVNIVIACLVYHPYLKADYNHRF